MPHPLRDFIAETNDTLTAFSRRIGVSRRTLSRILAGAAPRPDVARRIVEATGGAVAFDALYASAAPVADLTALRRDDAPDLDADLLTQVLGHVLGVIAGRGIDPETAAAAAEAAVGTHAALAAVTTRRGRDRLAQALRPVLAETQKDCPELGLSRDRLDEAVRRTVLLYSEAALRLQGR